MKQHNTGPRHIAVKTKKITEKVKEKKINLLADKIQDETKETAIQENVCKIFYVARWIVELMLTQEHKSTSLYKQMLSRWLYS